MADCEEEPDCCPLCMEELDITDQTFNACPCGYQVCLWCWHQIKNEYNGLCPACRQPYAELSKQKNPLDREDVVRRTKQRKQKEKSERRSAAQARHSTTNRKSLQNVRVMQRNLVYVIGLPQRFADEDALRSHECFGQYGKIVKAVVNKSHLNTDRANATASAYITFANKEDALCCIVAIDGYYLDGSMLRASFGTTKYCNFFLRNMQCNNPDCLYLHELGDEDDSFTKEEMQSALHSGKAAFRDMSMANGQIQEREGTEFPPPHRPHPPTRTASAANVRAPSPARGATLVRSHSEDAYADTQRHAQSAAAISKLRQAAGDSSNSSGSSSPDQIDRAAHNTEYPPLARGHSYSNIVAGGHSNSYSAPAPVPVPDPAPVDPVPSKKPELRVDTSREEDKTQAVDTVVGPLEALKLATGSSTEQPAWAQPFPTPAVSQSESEEQTTAINPSSAAGVYSPFGLGFEGGIRRASSAKELTSKLPVSSDMWGNSSTTDGKLEPYPPTAPTMPSTSSSSSFASIDAIFSQRNDSSEALAGLLGVQLAPNPLAHSAAPPTDARSSRFSFANPADTGRDGVQPMAARYELLDGTTVNNRSSFGGFEASRAGNAPPAPAGFPSMDRSGFPPLGSSQQHLPPPHPSRNSFGGDFRSNELPLGGSSALSGESGGLAFLQQMLPNVNISFGGDYPSLAGVGSSGLGADSTPSRSASAGRGRSPGRRLFERSQSAGGGLVSPDAWDGGSLSSLGFDGQSSARRASSGSSFYDPALVSQTSSGFSSNFYGFNSSNPMTPNDSENDRLRMHNDFGGDAYRRSGSLVNNS